jgi:predicted DNA-binding transcriptional regulator AlpA
VLRTNPATKRVRSSPAEKFVLTAAEAQLYLGLSKRSFYLLRSTLEQQFPAPFLMNGRDRWWRREIDEWAMSRKRRDAIPGRPRLAEAPAPEGI